MDNHNSLRWDDHFLHQRDTTFQQTQFIRLNVGKATARAYSLYQRQLKQLIAGYSRPLAANPDMLARSVVDRRATDAAR